MHESDLDLVFVYDHGPEADQSDGEKPLAASVYFMRLGQRLVGALTAPTGEGKLYEIDTRLRPSGNKGPTAVRLDGFTRYYDAFLGHAVGRLVGRDAVAFGEIGRAHV